jgi:hypothetical protein
VWASLARDEGYNSAFFVSVFLPVRPAMSCIESGSDNGAVARKFDQIFV